MRVTLLILLIASVPAFAKAVQPGENLRHQVDILAKMLSDGSAALAPKSIRVEYANLPNDFMSERSAVVLFTMASFFGGNNFRQFLAVFFHNPSNQEEGRPANGPYQAWRLAAFTVVGWDFNRVFDSFSVKNAKIRLTGDAWNDTDAHCCPSVHVYSVYKLSHDSLVLVSEGT